MNRIISSVIGLISIILIIYFLFITETKLVPSSVNLLSYKPTIIIDPGHGGEDGGTSSSDGTLEKHINLKIALKLRSMLEMSGYNTLMTRDKDIQLGDTSLDTIRQRKISDIKSRLKITQDNPNAILISIHQNHYSSPVYKGMQVFYSPNNEKSKVLADCIQLNTVNYLQSDNKRCTKKIDSNIYLLYNSTLPSVLVECGFMSNLEEATMLKEDEYQQKLAFSIMSGIQKFMEENNG